MSAHLDVFDRLANVARAFDDGELLSEVASLRERIDEGRFFVACVGQFKRGKSTLLNAVVGAPLMPTGVIPVTAIVTVLRHGTETKARIRTRGADWISVPVEMLSIYVSEEKNPNNEKNVEAVEVFAPSPWLASGMCLVDTPGLGSVFESNTVATKSFVPHVDAALVVLGGDPPISGEELELVADVATRVRHLIFVINKADRLSESDIAQALTFTQDVIAKRIGRTEDVFVVSASERRDGSITRDWSKLEHRLTSLAHSAGAELVMAARDRGVARIVRVLALEIEEHRRALLRPLDESAQRLEALARAVAIAEQTLAELEPLFRHEEGSLRRALELRREQFLEVATTRASTRLLEGITSTFEPKRSLRPRALEIAQRLAHEEIEAWARDLGPEVDRLYRKTTARFVSIANDFLRRVRTSGELFGTLPNEMDPDIGLQVPSHFYFTEMLTIASPPVGATFVDALRSTASTLQAVHSSTAPYLGRLLDTNSSRTIYDLIERVRESGTKLRSEISRQLRSTVLTARRAADRARDSRALGEPAVRVELNRLRDLQREVQSITPSELGGARAFQ